MVSRDQGQLLKVELSVLGAVSTVASRLSTPVGVALSADEQHAFVTEYGSGELSAVHLATGLIIPVASGLDSPAGVAIDRAESTAYVAEYGSGELSAVDAEIDRM